MTNNETGDNRPISLPCVCRRLLNNIVWSNITHLKQHNLFHVMRHGFCRAMTCKSHLGEFTILALLYNIHVRRLMSKWPSQAVVKVLHDRDRPIKQESMISETTYLNWFNALFEKVAIYSRKQQEIRSLTWTSLSQAQGSTTEPALTKIIKSYGSPVCRLYSHCTILHSVPHCQKLLCISITVNNSKKILKCWSGRKDGKIMFNNTKQEVLQISTLKHQHFTEFICVVSFSKNYTEQSMSRSVFPKISSYLRTLMKQLLIKALTLEEQLVHQRTKSDPLS